MPKRALGVRLLFAVRGRWRAHGAAVVPSQPAEAQSAVTRSATGQSGRASYACQTKQSTSLTAGDNADGYTLTEIASAAAHQQPDIDESLIQGQLWSVVGAGERVRQQTRQT